MSRPPVDPASTTSGIIVDPSTLERVIPESRRADGTVRKEIKIRPGFTPQEDVKRFRGTRQAQADANALPKGHIIGWTPPASNDIKVTVAMSQSARKNAKRKEKRKEKKVAEKVADNWEDDEDDAGEAKAPGSTKQAKVEDKSTDALTEDLKKLEVK